MRGDELKRRFLTKKVSETKHSKNSRPIHVAKGKKAYSEDNTKGVIEQAILQRYYPWI